MANFPGSLNGKEYCKVSTEPDEDDQCLYPYSTLIESPESKTEKSYREYSLEDSPAKINDLTAQARSTGQIHRSNFLCGDSVSRSLSELPENMYNQLATFGSICGRLTIGRPQAYLLCVVILLLPCLLTVRSSDMSLRLPDGFLLGIGSSSYQIEGGAYEDGKGESIWDRFTKARKDLIEDGSNGDIACDSYHKYQDDLDILKDLGVDFYRFSISWPRILPNGDISVISEAGIDYYNKIIDGLISNGIMPMVTIYHWELPQKLQDLGGWTNPILADFYEDYAELLFKTFGDRVKWWCTVNEPHLHSVFGHGQVSTFLPTHAPGIKYPGVADYLAGKTLLLAHARAYRLYQKHFYAEQDGKLGIVLDTFYYRPATNSQDDIDAAERAKIFEYGWFLNPIYTEEGNYPPEMIQRVAENSKAEGRRRSRLPELSPEEIELIKGTSDFLGLNHYTTYYTSNKLVGDSPSFTRDAGFVAIPDVKKFSPSPDWIKVEPEGFRELLVWIKTKYNNPTVLISENGCGDPENFEDKDKVAYHKLYINEVLKAIKEDSCDIIGYSAWSLLDSYEWTSGYGEKFGFYHVNFTDPNRKRTPKLSAKFYKQLAAERYLVL